MHNRRSEFFLIDMLIAIDKIKRKTTSITFDMYCHDAIADLREMHRTESVAYLTKIKNLIK